MLQSPIIKQRFHEDLSLARKAVLIDRLTKGLTYLGKQWSRHGVDFTTSDWAEVQELFAQLSEIDSLHDNEFDPRSERQRERFSDEMDAKFTKAEAPVRAAYAEKYPATAEAA